MVIFTTLAENDYFMGVSALINSMLKHGTYGNKLVIGYRGNLPQWLPALKTSKNGRSFMLNNDTFEIELVELIGSLHMVHEKPKWFKHLTDILEPDADEYFFFDSDIVVINRMSFFGEWVKQGVALCEDINYDMSSDNPIRKQWSSLAEANGLTINRKIDRYYNSGFLGWSKQTSTFVHDWDLCFEILSKKSGDMKKFRVSDRTSVVVSANQDSLNLAAMITTNSISTIGPAAMGFHQGLKLMVHPLGPKPWKRNFLKEFLSGNPPRVSDVFFWDNVLGNGLHPLPTYKVRIMQLLCRFLRGAARIYSRNATS